MGVYINGMEMPKSCFFCQMFDDNGDYPTCLLMGIAKAYKLDPFMRMPDCPLIEVPAPHGRLLDADDVFHVLTSYYHHSTDFQHEALKEALARVSTIIGAEDGE